jgi:O-antigen/teichoic acid export membrane protein
VTATSTPSKASFVADSLAIGMLVMLAMTIVQRGLGFIRGIWFCRLLDDAVLGQWAMAHDFMALVTPVVLLGMPGSLPRYVEHFRAEGHLPSFVRRLLIATVVLGTLFIALLMSVPSWFGWLVFLDPQSTSLVYCLGVGVLTVIAYHFTYKLVSSLRQIRVASTMQLVQTVSFTVIGISWLTSGGGISGLVYAFAAATILAIIPGALSLTTGWSGLPKSESAFDARSMWRRLLPYAAALWAMNLLTNVFAVADRYMILHFLPVGEINGQAAVGQYHSGRIIPVFLMSLATMVSGVLLPYLSADWEAGRRDAVRDRLRKILFAVSVSFSAGAAVTLLLAPWFFSAILENRYTEGLHLMPMAFVFCIWVALATIGQNYLWVAERGKLVAVVIGVGLITNVVLNLMLLPLFGLHGAVVATLVANAVVLLGIWLAMNRHGYELDNMTFYATIIPATLLAGPGFALSSMAIICLACPRLKTWCSEAVFDLQNRTV